MKYLLDRHYDVELNLLDLDTRQLLELAVRLDLIDGAQWNGEELVLRLASVKLEFTEEQARLYLRGLLRGHVHSGAQGVGSSTPAPAERVVLIADDDADDVLFTERAFRRLGTGVRVEAVEDGEQALDYLFRRGPYAAAPRPDLVLLDLNMPGRSGWEVLDEMKATPDLRSIPVAILTTLGTDDIIERGYEAGSNVFLTKPVAQDDLRRVLHTLDFFWRGAQ